MKATINNLFETGREIISFDGSEFERPQKIGDLKKCDNVVIGDKINPDPRCKEYSVLIEDDIYIVSPNYVMLNGFRMNFLEIL